MRTKCAFTIVGMLSILNALNRTRGTRSLRKTKKVWFKKWLSLPRRWKSRRPCLTSRGALGATQRNLRSTLKLYSPRSKLERVETWCREGNKSEWAPKRKQKTKTLKTTTPQWTSIKTKSDLSGTGRRWCGEGEMRSLQGLWFRGAKWTSRSRGCRSLIHPCSTRE